MTRRRALRIGNLRVDAVTSEEALDVIARLVERGRGGTVFTPNVDHVVQAENDGRLRRAYEEASLSLADGMPIVWSSRLLGCPLPEKISGSDFVVPVLERAAAMGWRVFLLGGAYGVAARAANVLSERIPSLRIVGTDSSRIDLDEDASSRAAMVARLKAADPHLVLVALGAPKQEIWSHAVSADLAPAVLLGIGASLDFIAGVVRRAPRWVSASGFEWLYRLGQEPRRLWRRYLVRDPKFLLVVARSLRTPRRERVIASPVDGDAPSP